MFVLLATRMAQVVLVTLAMGALSVVVVCCGSAPASPPVGLWRSSEYPSEPPNHDLFLEIRSNGEYSLSTVPGHGTWSLQGDVLVLRPYPGVKGGEFKVESQPRRLRSMIMHEVDFLPVVVKSGMH